MAFPFGVWIDEKGEIGLSLFIVSLMMFCLFPLVHCALVTIGHFDVSCWCLCPNRSAWLQAGDSIRNVKALQNT